MDAVPDGEWFCPDCVANPGAPVGASRTKGNKSKGKRKLEDENESDAKDASSSKKKAPAKPGEA